MTDATSTHSPSPHWAGLRAKLVARLPTRRVMLKWGHLLMIPLTVWFVIATPRFVSRNFGTAGTELNSDIALLFVTICLIWSVDHMLRGLVGRPGPKLSPRLRIFHRLLHKTIVWGLFCVALGGFLLGLTADRVLFAGGWLPIAPPLDLERANHVIGKIHIYQFYALAALTLGHGAFHVWRHLWLKDNALRIMAPKVLHRFL